MKAFRFPGDLEADPPEAAALWDAGCRGMQQDGDTIVAWFDEQVPLQVAGAWEAVPDEDWLERYYRELQPVTVGQLVISPSHAEVTLRAPERPLWLDPGSAFGTGHHETTRLAIRALQTLDPFGKRVLDVGAGSGILAIAADLLGASTAHGVDVDPATVPVARANARINGSRATFAAGELAPGDPAHRCDLLLANLFSELHLRLAAGYAAALEPGGRAALTGVLGDRAAAVRDALTAAGLTVEAEERDGEWTLLLAARPARFAEATA